MRLLMPSSKYNAGWMFSASILQKRILRTGENGAQIATQPSWSKNAIIGRNYSKVV